MRFDGAVYEARAVEVAPSAGQGLGTGVVPGCDDTVFVRGRDAPPEVEALRRAPACDPGDEPLALSGPWLGILGAEGHTELDLQPPYDLSVLVEQASAARYERAFLVVRVPASLGTPLTRADVESSLREGGDLRLRVRCGVHGEYVAEAVGARPGG